MSTRTGTQTAFVFGGGQGIGRAAARKMAASGVRIGIADLNAAAAQEAADEIGSGFDVQTAHVGVDITDIDDTRAAVERLERALGPVTIVVNSAAIVSNKLFVDSKPADWRRMIDVCLFGPLNILHVVLPGMRQRQFGRIIYMASDAARTGQSRMSYYAAAKAGVIGLVKSVAQEVGRYQITVNVVSPGATNTDLRKAREEETRRNIGEEKYAERQKRVLRQYPMGRLGEPEDAAAAIAFLAGPDASWITGQAISVNGGFSML